MLDLTDIALAVAVLERQVVPPAARVAAPAGTVVSLATVRAHRQLDAYLGGPRPNGRGPGGGRAA